MDIWWTSEGRAETSTPKKPRNHADLALEHFESFLAPREPSQPTSRPSDTPDPLMPVAGYDQLLRKIFASSPADAFSAALTSGMSNRTNPGSRARALPDVVPLANGRAKFVRPRTPAPWATSTCRPRVSNVKRSTHASSRPDPFRVHGRVGNQPPLHRRPRASGRSSTTSAWNSRRAVSSRYCPMTTTPAMTSGKSLDGSHRSHRIQYSGNGVELRMPSATAIKRFSAENGKRTFDVPVEIEHGGGKTSKFQYVTDGTPKHRRCRRFRRTSQEGRWSSSLSPWRACWKPAARGCRSQGR